MKPRLLLIVTTDPRISPRPAEAVRIAAGVGAWQKIDVTLYLRDAAVLADAVPNSGSESIAHSALHEIAGEVTDQRFGRITGQEEMSEIVHARQR